jgi:hypothetical protein
MVCLVPTSDRERVMIFETFTGIDGVNAMNQAVSN